MNAVLANEKPARPITWQRQPITALAYGVRVTWLALGWSRDASLQRLPLDGSSENEGRGVATNDNEAWRHGDWRANQRTARCVRIDQSALRTLSCDWITSRAVGCMPVANITINQLIDRSINESINTESITSQLGQNTTLCKNLLARLKDEMHETKNFSSKYEHKWKHTRHAGTRARTRSDAT